MAGPAKNSLVKGSRCNNTAAVQNALNIMNGGKNNLKIDGIFGDNTESAVKTFQRACGLLDDGKVGDLTGTQLFEVISVEQILTLELPRNAFNFTGKAPRLPPLLDTAGKLLARRNLVQGWTEIPRLEKSGLTLDKLELRHIGLNTATMIAHGVTPTVLQKPLAALEKLVLNGTMPQSIQISGTTKDVKKIVINYSIDKIVQPRAPSFFKPFFNMEGKLDFDKQNINLSGSWQTKVGVASPTLKIGPWLEAGVNANLWASANGAIGMGGATGDVSGGATVEGKAVMHILKTELALGPIKRVQIDAFAGFNLGMSFHGVLRPDGVQFNLIPPKLGKELGVNLNVFTFQ